MLLNEYVIGFWPVTNLFLLVGDNYNNLPEVIRKLRYRDAEVAIDFTNNTIK
jgi:hypothetical protein